MTKKGYVTGRPGNLFAPKANLSRCEAVKMIDNVMGELINAGGTYTRVVPGNMVISSPGVTLKDTYIAGDLYLTVGIGTDAIKLIGVAVKGKTIIAGCIESISLTDTLLEQDVLVLHEEGKVTITAEGLTEVGTVTVCRNAVLSEQDLTGSGFSNIQIAGTVIGKEIVLKGDFEDIAVETPQAGVTLETGTVKNFVVDNEATGTWLTAKDGSAIENLTLYAETEVTGGNKIKNAVIASSGVSMDKKPQQVTLAEGGQTIAYSNQGNTQGQSTPRPSSKPGSTPKPTSKPRPTVEPTQKPTNAPTPTQGPTSVPTPTQEPTAAPTAAPTPTQGPTATPTPITDQKKVYYIRQGANGANDGADWINAYTKLPDVLERGATYYIASGTYPSYKFDDPEIGDSYIVIKKATVNDYGTDVGWKDGYAAGVALFTDDKGPIFRITTGHYIIDGQTGSEDSGHGIKLYNPMNIEPHSGGNCMQIPNGTEVRHLTLKHIEMEDAGWAGSAKDVPYKTRTVYATGATAHITFQYCYIHESGQEWMLFSSPESDFLVEHCYFKNGGSGSSDYHSVGVWHRSSGGDMNIHIRYNTFENFAAAGGTGYISLGYRGDKNVETYSSGYYIYGNIFKETSPLAGPSRAIGSNGANGGPFLSDVKIFNNVFYNLQNNSSNINLANKGNENLAANNIWYGCERQVPNINIESKNNILNDLPEDPFIDADNGNFCLSSELPGGMELDEPFDKDMYGAARGADNVWDIGAYEYVKAKDVRPRIENNTLVAPDGSRLRGGTFWLYGWISSKTSWALSDAPWQAIHDNKLNAVRIACAYRPEKEGNYSLDEYEELLDQLIDRAEKEGVTAVIDYHPEPGNYYNTTTGDELDTYENNKKHAREFWTRFASRYKDRKNVVFELVNEPVFDSPNDYNSELIKDFSELWQLCHELAPEIPIIVFSFCQVGGHASDIRDWPSERAGWLEGIDWRKTAVGFHSYWRDSSERIVDLKSKYPCINTEFMTYPDGSGMKEMDGYERHGTLMEELGVSWLQWDILDRPESLDKLQVVIDDLKEHEVYWQD
jgi:hypothetical protein